MRLPILDKPKGYTLYTGKSPFNDDNIAVIAILHSDNSKTGDMIQVYIINTEINPIAASKNNRDNAVCGNCKHRGNNGKMRTCYVNLATGVSAVYNNFIRGKYPVLNEKHYFYTFRNRFVRFGAYGEPTLIPIDIVASISSHCLNWTGYTHKWNTCNAKYQRYLMASVDNRKEYVKAHSMGWRTFRIRKSNDKIYQREFICPASVEGGNRLQCFNCNACNGTKDGKLTSNHGSVTIIAHGKVGEKRFGELQKLTSVR